MSTASFAHTPEPIRYPLHLLTVLVLVCLAMLPLLFPQLALAGEEETAAAWAQVVIALGGPLLGIIGWLLKRLTDHGVQKAKSERLKRIVDQTDDLAIRVAQETWKSTVKALKKGAADGRLTNEEKADAKQAAKDALKAYLGPKGLAELGKFFGGPLEDLLGTFVDTGVAKAKAMNKAKKTNPAAVTLPR